METWDIYSMLMQLTSSGGGMNFSNQNRLYGSQHPTSPWPTAFVLKLFQVFYLGLFAEDVYGCFFFLLNSFFFQIEKCTLHFTFLCHIHMVVSLYQSNLSPVKSTYKLNLNILKFLQDFLKFIKFKSVTTMKISMLIFWVVTPYGLIGRYQQFGGTYCLRLHS